MSTGRDFYPGLGICLGLLGSAGAVASFLYYQRPSEIGINSLLLGVGLSCVISGYLSLSKEGRGIIKDFCVKLRLAKETLVTCVCCRSYVGQYEIYTNVSLEGRMRVNYHVPNFSEGICMEKGMIIHDGYNPRRCVRFEQRKARSLSSTHTGSN
jgi:hypothetical protein